MEYLWLFPSCQGHRWKGSLSWFTDTFEANLAARFDPPHAFLNKQKVGTGVVQRFKKERLLIELLNSFID